ncbi:uncharacterized protein LOC101235561 isoform X3 [Hydra vulgaris]|uniref:Uncharacterized protein LOC101235561 isoform X3 n=1 Tax=Hydra vulgaris TaxID=6087 RepID=A0ABM4C1T9_HYDVU
MSEKKKYKDHDIFKYDEYIPSASATVSDPCSNWFNTDNKNEKKVIRKEWKTPDWYTHHENQSLQSTYVPNSNTNFLSFDNLYCWQRSVSPKLPSFSEKVIQKTPKESKTYDTIKLPEILHRGMKKTDNNRDMFKLLDYTYQRDFIIQSQEANAELRKKKVEKRRIMKEKLKNDQNDYRRNKKEEKATAPKPLFKLSKFEKVPACVDSHRLK